MRYKVSKPSDICKILAFGVLSTLSPFWWTSRPFFFGLSTKSPFWWRCPKESQGVLESVCQSEKMLFLCWSKMCG